MKNSRFTTKICRSDDEHQEVHVDRGVFSQFRVRQKYRSRSKQTMQKMPAMTARLRCCCLRRSCEGPPAWPAPDSRFYPLPAQSSRFSAPEIHRLDGPFRGGGLGRYLAVDEIGRDHFSKKTRPVWRLAGRSDRGMNLPEQRRPVSFMCRMDDLWFFSCLVRVLTMVMPFSRS